MIFSLFFWKILLKIVKNIVTFPLDVLSVNTLSNKWKIFLQKISRLNFKNFFNFWVFYWKIYHNPHIQISDKEVIYYFSDKKFHTYIENINNLLQNHILKWSYVTSFEEMEKNYFRIQITKESETIENLKKKIISHKSEIISFFAKNNFAPDVDIQANKDEFTLFVFDKNLLWKTQKFDEKIFNNLQKWEILLGFYPENKNGIFYKNFSIFASKIFHFLIVGASRSGKDVVSCCFIFSILQNIKKFSNAKLHFFDTKKSDGMYLENLKSYGIFRYDNFEKYAEILEIFIQEMQEIQAKIGMYSNIENYNKNHPKNPLKYRFVIINEFLALGSMLKWRELQKFTSALIALTSQWASAGFKIIFISQSARSDGVDDFAKILLNIKTKCVLRLYNPTEASIMSRWMNEVDSDKIRNIWEYRTMFVEDNEIKQEFKAYLLEQEALKEWIVKNFEGITSEMFPEKIQDYYNFAKKNEGISLKEATETFHLTRAEWDSFVKILEERNEIQRLPNNAIVWRKKEG